MVVGGHVIVDISFSNSSSSSILYIVLFLPLLLLLAYTIITVYNIQYTLKYISRMASVRDSSVIIIIETAAPRQGGAGGGEEEVEKRRRRRMCSRQNRLYRAAKYYQVLCVFPVVAAGVEI